MQVWEAFVTTVYLPHTLQVQSRKLYINKYVIALTQITSTEIFPFIAVLVFMLLSRKFCV